MRNKQTIGLQEFHHIYRVQAAVKMYYLIEFFTSLSSAVKKLLRRRPKVETAVKLFWLLDIDFVKAIIVLNPI